MLTILSPEQVEHDKNRIATEIQKRVWGLAEEESELVNRVNTLRDTEQKETQRIAKEFAAQESKNSAILSDLEGKVTALEKRREQAMRPIKELETEAKQRIDAVAKREQSVELREKDLQDKEIDLREIAENQMDNAEDLAGRQTLVEKRERGVESEAARLKISGSQLTAKWAEFHTSVYKKTEELVSRESRVLTDTKANDIIREELDARARDLNARDLQIRDRYATLMEAIKEFDAKHHG